MFAKDDDRLLTRDDDAAKPFVVPFIETGYRQPQASVWACLWSGACRCHNESACVHSHLWPAVYLAVRAVSAMCFTLPAAIGAAWSVRERLAWTFYFFSSVACFASSAVFHSLLSHESVKVRSLAHQIDYIGIQLLIGSTNVLAFSLGFECFPAWQALYVSVSATLLVLGVILYLGNWSRPEYKAARLAMFATSSLLGFGPLLQWKFLLTEGRVTDSTVFADILWFYVLFGVAFAFYASRFPERLFRRVWWIDLGLSSHVLWHVFTAAAAIHFVDCVLRFRLYRVQFGCSQER